MRVSLALALLIASQVSAQAQTGRSTSSRPSVKAQSCGPVVDGVLKCPRFGFTYKAPFGWVDRTSEMQNEDSADSESDKSASPGTAKSETLLAMFERPPGAPDETIDSAVVIAAEPAANYQGVKQAADYFGPITDLAGQQGFKPESDPYSFAIGAKQLVRGDFTRPRGQLIMLQSSLVMIEKGYIVSFTFVGGNQDEVDELIEGLKFGTQTKPAGPAKSH